MVHMTVISGGERRRRWSASEREEIVMASFAPGAVVARVARQYDVSTSLIYKWRREARQPGMFVPAVMTEDEGSLVPAAPRDGRRDSRRDDHGEDRADSPVIRVDLAGGASVSIAATAPARLVLAVLQALR